MENDSNQVEPRSWPSELRYVQTWLESHPVLLGGYAILIPSISIYHYTNAEHVPLSVASPDIISSLPSVLAAIAFLVLALAALPLIPALLMVEGATRDASGRLYILPIDSLQRQKDVFHWFLAFMLPGAIIALGISMSVFFFPKSSLPVTGAAIFATALFTLSVHIKKGKSLKKFISPDTLIHVLVSLLQILLAISAMQACLRFFGQSPTDRETLFALLIAILGVPTLQMLLVMLVELTSHRYGFVMQAFLGAACLISILCVVPTTGAFLAGHVIGGSASGYHKCTQLQLLNSAVKFNRIISKDGSTSVPVKILSKASGIYLVRDLDIRNQAVYRIPETDVVALVPCRQVNKGK